MNGDKRGFYLIYLLSSAADKIVFSSRHYFLFTIFNFCTIPTAIECLRNKRFTAVVAYRNPKNSANIGSIVADATPNRPSLKSVR